MEGTRKIRGSMGWPGRLALGLLPFAVVVAWYAYGSWQGHQENEKYKILPNWGQFKDGFDQIFQKRTHMKDGVKVTETWFGADTLASLKRMGISLLITLVASVLIGLFMGTFTPVDAATSPFIRAVSKVPPMALLPLFFVLLGVTEERTKYAIMVAGTMPILTQDVYLKVRDVPVESINKAFTLGASTLEVTVRVILFQAWPRILDGVRLMLGPLWALLIVSENIAATEGLGYRIYVVQRQIGMHIIIPYVLWITVLAFAMDQAIKLWIRFWHPWVLES